jgi:hypothetical protein
MPDSRACIVYLRVLAALALLAGCSTPPILELDSAALQARCVRDLEAVRVYRRGIESVAEFINTQPEPPERRPGNGMLGREERELALETWKRLLEYQLALDVLGSFHSDWHHVDQEPQRTLSFLVAYASFLAEYRFALEVIDRVEKDPALPTVLDEPVPEIGLSDGTYRRYKSRFLNIARATEFAALSLMHKHRDEQPLPEINAGIAADAERIWKFGERRGHVLTMANAFDIVRGWGFAAWFPVQAGVSEWMGDTKVARLGRGLISQNQIRALDAKLQPGDILLTRREWYLSNVGLPGYWPHAALYVGTREERQRYFDDPEVRTWVESQDQEDGDLEALIESRYPEAHALSLIPQEHGDLPRVIEAISEGVSFTTIEHSAAADSLVALRPRLGKAEKARAVLRAFHFSGRPYDFDFSFLTDETIVCTELVYKSYEPGAGMSGILFPLTTVLGRPVMPANLIVRQFDENHGTAKQQLELIEFLDGREPDGIAIVETTETFRASWKRPKWHIMMQDPLPEGK